MAEGHPDAWSYTPRQVYFWLKLVYKRKARQTLHDLQMTFLATQGTRSAIAARVRALQKEINA